MPARPIEGLSHLGPSDYQSIHRGYDTAWANQDPNRILPLDAIRVLQKRGVLGITHPKYYVTSGQGTYVKNATRMAGEIAKELKTFGVEGVMLVAT